MFQRTSEGLWKESSAWADFTLSKTALILASFIIICAICNLESDLMEMNKEMELDAIAVELRSVISQSANEGFENVPKITCSLDLEEKGIDGNDLDIYISGEYVRVEKISDERTLRSVKPLTFRTMVFDESTLRNELSDKFGHNGSKEDPVISEPMQIIEFLYTKGSQEMMVDKENDICIQKTSVYIDTFEGIRKLECLLVYQ